MQINKNIFSIIPMQLMILSLLLIPITGCQIPYLLRNSKEQIWILSQRENMETIVTNQDKQKELNLDEEQIKKLLLAKEAKVFAETNLKLTPSNNYTTFVQLNRPYVTWVVSAAPKWELVNYKWWFPIVGDVPYKGFYEEKLAQEEARDFQNKNFDTYVRGVSAYSTLGWFDDPILSSMLRYKKQDLVNTIIHESVHATLFIKNSADFNEQLATYLGNKGTELFYLSKEGDKSESLIEINMSNHDDQIFTAFISDELQKLAEWYKNNNQKDESTRENYFREIQYRFDSEVKPKLKSNNYNYFSKVKLNNARLLVYKTYFNDLSDFELVFQKVNQDFKQFIDLMKSFRNSKDPREEMKLWLQSH